MGNLVITRVPHNVPSRRSRNAQERLIVRFPGAWRALAALGSRLLSPRSRLRRAMLWREVVSGWQATSRQDFELVQVRYARDAHLEFDPDYEGVGFTGPFRSILEREQAFQQAWQRFEVVPAAIIDLGDRVVVLGKVELTGKASGLELESEVAQLLIAPRGLVKRDQIFLSWDRGLRAAGLDRAAIERSLHAQAGQPSRRS